MSDVRWVNAGRRIKVEPTTVTHSPSFQAAYPRLINDQLIDPASRAAMEVSWNKGFFAEREFQIFVVRNVYVVGECLILDQNLQVLENVGDPYTDEEIERAIRDIRMASEAATLPHLDRLTILTKRRAAHNYGHYLIEMLPMAVIGAMCIDEKRPRYLVHRVPPPSQDVVFRSLRLLGIDLNEVLVQGSHEPMHFENLVVVRGLTVHGTYMSPFSVMSANMMVKKVAETWPNTLGPEHHKLFVKRVPGWRRGRDLHNEVEVAERLAKRGFWPIEPGTLSLDQQIALFSRATQVVGVIGAAMTNIAFCQPGTKVTMLVPGTFPDTFLVHRPAPAPRLP